MMDLDGVKRSADLLALVGSLTPLKKIASTEGGEYAGPCPFCPEHGKDRFRVQPDHRPFGRWMCHRCTESKWQDAIALGRRLWPELTFAEVCQRLGGGTSVPMSQTAPQSAQSPVYQPPDMQWQQDAGQAVKICKQNLWGDAGKQALAELRRRGLRDQTIDLFSLGYCPGASFGSGRLYVPRGIVIPCIERGRDIWYLKVSLLPGEAVKCEGCGRITPARAPCGTCGKGNKYRGVRGNRPAAFFNSDWLKGSEIALFCEGEFDCMIAHQELNDVIACATLGSAGNRIDLAAWGRYLLPIEHMLVCLDNDAAGHHGTEFFTRLSNRVRTVTLPGGVKDLNDFYLQGNSLWEWIKPVLDEVDPLPERLMRFVL